MTADRIEQFEADIAASPAALARLLDGWRPVRVGPSQRIVFVGLGSSRFAAEGLAPLLRARGRSASVDVAGAESGTMPAGDVTLIAISASGGSREVVDAAARHRGRGPVIAVTNRADSRLGAAADELIVLEAGEETSGIACRTFRATIAALALLTGLTSVDGLRPVVDRLAARLDGRRAWLDPLVSALDGAPAIDVLGDGPMVGAAEQAALMLREGPRLPAHAWHTVEWLHTAVYLAWPGHRVVLYPGSVADADVEEAVTRRSGVLLRMTTTDGDPVTRAILDSTLMEMVGLELWRRATGEAR